MKHSLLGPLTILIAIGIFAMSSISLYGQNLDLLGMYLLDQM